MGGGSSYFDLAAWLSPGGALVGSAFRYTAIACNSGSGTYCRLAPTTSAIGPTVEAFAVALLIQPVFRSVRMSPVLQFCRPASCGLVSDGAYQSNTRPPEGPACACVPPSALRVS